MKSNWLFYLGVFINAFVILICVSNAFMSYKSFDGINGASHSPVEGMTVYGRFMLWFIPLALLAIIGGSYWFKSNAKMLAANILLWIPALPMLVMIILWGGLAMIFVLFGK